MGENEELRLCPFCNGEATVIQCILQGSVTYGVTCVMPEQIVPVKITTHEIEQEVWED